MEKLNLLYFSKQETYMFRPFGVRDVWQSMLAYVNFVAAVSHRDLTEDIELRWN